MAAAEPLGDPVLFHRAAGRLGIDLAAAGPAQDSGLLELGGRVEFAHPLVRSAVYRSAAANDRRRVHRALAEATPAGTDPDRRAWHRARGRSWSGRGGRRRTRALGRPGAGTRRRFCNGLPSSRSSRRGARSAHRLALELTDRQATTLAAAIAETDTVAPEVAKLRGIALASVFQIIITEAGRRTREGQSQDQIADQLRPAIEAVLDDLDAWLTPAADQDSRSRAAAAVRSSPPTSPGPPA
jgi:hypothetical protein